MDKKTILIIEDDEFFNDMVSSKLKETDFEVVQTGDSKEAFEYLDKNIPDLILLDLILPGMDGYEILSLIKKDNRTSSIPVVISSNLGQKDEIDRAMSLGADEFLVKVNFIPDEIVERVKMVLRKKYI